MPTVSVKYRVLNKKKEVEFITWELIDFKDQEPKNEFEIEERLKIAMKENGIDGEPEIETWFY